MDSATTPFTNPPPMTLPFWLQKKNVPSCVCPTRWKRLIDAPGSVSKKTPSTPVEVFVTRTTWVGEGLVSESSDSSRSAFTLLTAPLPTVATTSNVHESPERFVSHVHHKCQCPPATYSTKTPTPVPGGSLSVMFGSTVACVTAGPPVPESFPVSPSGGGPASMVQADRRAKATKAKDRRVMTGSIATAMPQEIPVFSLFRRWRERGSRSGCETAISGRICVQGTLPAHRWTSS